MCIRDRLRSDVTTKLFCQELNISDQQLSDLEVSGFIKIEDNDIHLKENGRWLCDPPEVKIRERKQSEDWIPTGLVQLVDIIGRPLDWIKNPKRYRQQYLNIKKKYSDNQLQEFANKIKDKVHIVFDRENALGQFLSDRGIDMIKDYKPPKNKRLSDDNTGETIQF